MVFFDRLHFLDLPRKRRRRRLRTRRRCFAIGSSRFVAALPWRRVAFEILVHLLDRVLLDHLLKLMHIACRQRRRVLADVLPELIGNVIHRTEEYALSTARVIA